MVPIQFEGPVGINEADSLSAGARDGYAHNILFVHEIRGALDVERLGRAARWVAARHEAFRTAFVMSAAGWRRVVYERTRFDLEVIDLASAPDPEQAAGDRVRALYRTPFDRSQMPLIRALLLRLAEGRYWFISFCDHLSLDGVGFGNCMTELLLVYGVYSQGQIPMLPPAQQPREHVAAVEALLAPVRAQPGAWSAAYPKDGFALRGDLTPTGERDRAGARCFAPLGDSQAVAELARRLGVSRSAPLVAAMALGLRAIADREDVGFTMIRSGRRDAESRRIVGCLAWGDAFSTRIAEDDPLAAVVARADAFVQDASPWRMLYIPAVDPPTRRVVLNINRYDTTLELPEVQIFPRLDVLNEIIMWDAHDLLVHVFPLPGLLQGVIRYRCSLISQALAERFAAAMSGAVRALLADPSAPVRSLG